MKGALEWLCYWDGHRTEGPTGDSMVCVRCNKHLDGLGLDPTLDNPAPTSP